MEQFATRCPHCHTPFRVTQAQLEQRGGKVRCGVCRETFDGIDQLFDFGGKFAAPAVAMPSIAATSVASSASPAGQAPAANPADRMALLDLGPSADPAAAPAASAMQAELDALSLAIADLQAKPWSETPPPAVAETQAHEPDEHLVRDDDDNPRQADDDDLRFADRDHFQQAIEEEHEREPAFVQSARRRSRGRRLWKILLWIAIPLLTLALAAQLVYYFRSEIAARSPQAARQLRALCAELGCTVRLPMRLDKLSLAASQLDASPMSPPATDADASASASTAANATRLTLVALLRNQGDTVQAWPSIDLQLKGADGKVVVRKAFLPAQYLRAEEIPTGMPAHSETEIRIPFELAGEAPAGFELTLFYH